MPRQQQGYVDAEKLPLDEWLAYLAKPQNQRPFALHSFQFPSNRHFDEYLSTIAARSDKDIKLLLRNLLIMGGSLGVDTGRFVDYSRQPDLKELLEEHEYVKRLFDRKRHTWEGMSWVIDLLPHFPREAIAALEAYNLSHYFILPDGRARGLMEAIAVLRAKYLEQVTEHNFVDTVSPRDFEFLVASLYIADGYVVSVTQQTRDEGCDIIATKETGSSTERILVECKRKTASIPVVTARALSGILDSFHATRGVIVSTSTFTRPAIAFAKATARIELVDHRELSRRLSAQFGPTWPRRLSDIVVRAKASAREAPLL